MKFIKHDFSGPLKKWLPFAFITTALFLFCYIAVQQTLRMSANDRQVEYINNIEIALNEGTPYKYFNGTHPIDMDKSLSTFIILYDSTGTPLGGNGIINGNFPIPPKGVFNYLLSHKEDRFTWEPAPGVRQAVVARYHGGVNPAYIVVGGSLTEVEKHIKQIGHIALALWSATLLGSFILIFFLS